MRTIRYAASIAVTLLLIASPALAQDWLTTPTPGIPLHVPVTPSPGVPPPVPPAPIAPPLASSAAPVRPPDLARRLLDPYGLSTMPLAACLRFPVAWLLGF